MCRCAVAPEAAFAPAAPRCHEMASIRLRRRCTRSTAIRAACIRIRDSCQLPGSWSRKHARVSWSAVNQEANAMPDSTPAIIEMQVIPVAGHDSMLLNLAGAHGPFFTRIIVILKDTAGHTGIAEVPGSEAIRQ